MQELNFSLACWLSGQWRRKVVGWGMKGPDSSMRPALESRRRPGLASGPPPTHFPPPGPSATRRRPPAVPRALYQIINKAAGAVRVNILAGLAGHCRGGCPPWPPRGHQGPATPIPAPRSLWASASPLLFGAASASTKVHVGGRAGHPEPTSGNPSLTGLLSAKGGEHRVLVRLFLSACPHSLENGSPEPS